MSEYECVRVWANEGSVFECGGKGECECWGNKSVCVRV